LLALPLRRPVARPVLADHENLRFSDGSRSAHSDIASIAGWHQVVPGIVEAVSVNVINDQVIGPSVIPAPSYRSGTPVAPVHSRTNRLEENETMFHDLPRRVGEGVSSPTFQYAVLSRRLDPTLLASIDPGARDRTEPARHRRICPYISVKPLPALKTVTQRHSTNVA
jgi:hypothetical protein